MHEVVVVLRGVNSPVGAQRGGAQHEERLLSGRYVITTSLDKKTASTAQVVGHYKALQSAERRFRVLKDFLALRPVFHYTETACGDMSRSACSPLSWKP